MSSFIRLALIMVSVHSSKTLTKTEVGTRGWNIAVIGLTVLLFRRMWILWLWIWKAMKCFKRSVMGYPSQNMKDCCYWEWFELCRPGPILSVKNFNMWPRERFCDILVKNMAAFCPCLKSLPEAHVKRFRLLWRRKSKKRPGINSIVWLKHMVQGLERWLSG